MDRTTWNAHYRKVLRALLPRIEERTTPLVVRMTRNHYQYNTPPDVAAQRVARVVIARRTP